ncbi:hypothetical protein B0A50_06677 [Salinomyces thailandicus]|uniref:Rhamnogalacturonase A/B/Epimerase-like pectate lyase domain-containing protein n=1 Tax=Salinomyces thailandicus TaxID=706561 RepID=A0A4U0TR11_9PEZI|nr:hypothetical protein B0A50_06677 [Salinomyces thailandica]
MAPRNLTTLATALCAFLSLITLSPVTAAPAPVAQASAATGAAAARSSNPPSNTNDSPNYWLGQAEFHQNYAVWGQPLTNYPLYRNVKDYGAKGDGTTDDTEAINFAMNSTGPPGTLTPGRCTNDCNSSTISPAIVYFPAGTYLVSTAINMPYYTQVVGDHSDLPTVLASADFSGMAVFDADPYDYTQNGRNWFINQNNFFRQMRNLIIDLRQINEGKGAGIHWQVAQATSLQNIVFEMVQGGTTTQQGIFMDNGSGGYMSDLTFNGGSVGAFLGSQQFTSRNLVFNNCKTAILLNWSWGWTFSNITVNGDSSTNSTGLDMSVSPANQTAGSAILADSTITGVQYGVRTAFNLGQNVPATGGSIVVDNVDMSGVTEAGIITVNGTTLLQPGNYPGQYITGSVYDNSPNRQFVQKLNPVSGSTKSPLLLENGQADGKIFGRSKPMYESASRTDFLFAIRDGGLTGDGATDDTLKMQAFLQAASQQNKIAYFEHGVYKVTDTITIPVNGMRIVGECWSTILASGFNDVTNPKPVWQVGGSDGVTGAGVEISGMLFEILGPNPGAIMLQWNLHADDNSQSGMWDSHVRMGGSYGSELLLEQCNKFAALSTLERNCQAGFLMFYASPRSGNILLDNTWFWTADHDMEDEGEYSSKNNNQTSIFNARGVLVRSSGPVWLWGTASEHSVFYNYQFQSAGAVFAGFMQTETPYMQPTPLAPQPFAINTKYGDPEFTVCRDVDGDATSCRDAWGLRIWDSKNILIHSAGLYSFFNDYTQECLATHSCQQNMVHIQNSQVDMYALTTIGATNMWLDDAWRSPVLAEDNMDVYGSTVAYLRTTR